MQSLSVRVLGEFDVDGVEPQTLGSRKARLLLWLLALGRGRFVSGDALAEALWGEAMPTNPSDQLSVLVSRLRGVLGRERLEHGDGGYRLRYDWLDADELAAVVVEVEHRQADGNVVGAAAAGRVALSLMRGDVAAAPVAGAWAQGQLAELERLVVRARRISAASLSAAGRWIEAADLAAAALERDPYDEDALRLLMRANVAGGRVGSALAAFAEARQRLIDDLGADPSLETAELHAAILRGELAPATSAPEPAAAHRLVGREGPLARLDSIAARSHSGTLQIAVIEGAAGIGKTSLLRAWAARRAALGDVVLTAACGQLDQAAPLDALVVAIATYLHQAGQDRTADVLGEDAELLGPILGLTAGTALSPMLADGVIGPSALFSALLAVLQRLAKRAPVVLILDDAHQAGPTLTDWLRFIRRHAAPLVVVAGMRSGEGQPLPADEAIQLGPLDHAAATALVGASRIDELYARSGGHPLFLTELAASENVAGLPASLVEVVSSRCDELGTAGATLRSAAVIGPQLDIELLSAVLRRPAIELLDDVEQAVARQLLVDDGGVFWFRHELVRAALGASATGRPIRPVASAGRPGAEPPRRCRSGPGRPPRQTGRRSRPRRPLVAGSGGPRRRAVRPRDGRSAARRCRAASPGRGGLAGARPRSHPTGPLRRRLRGCGACPNSRRRCT